MYSNYLTDKMESYKIEEAIYEYDTMQVPGWWNYVNPSDVEYLNKLILSRTMEGKMTQKQKIIKEVMLKNGWKKLAGGTNRLVFFYPDDPRVVAKVAIDRIGVSDNPNEYRIQEVLKPFCSKMFHTSPCGTLGISERVVPITRYDQFVAVAPRIADLILGFLTLDDYIMEDIGIDYFMNWGISKRIGPVLLDYPYVYVRDKSKMICKAFLPNTFETCLGNIVYDNGLNHLFCSRCGKQYKASDLKKDIDNNSRIDLKFKGGTIPMRFSINRGDKKVSINDADIIATNKRREEEKRAKRDFSFSIKHNGETFNIDEARNGFKRDEKSNVIDYGCNTPTSSESFVESYHEEETQPMDSVPEKPCKCESSEVQPMDSVPEEPCKCESSEVQPTDNIPEEPCKCEDDHDIIDKITNEYKEIIDSYRSNREETTTVDNTFSQRQPIAINNGGIVSNMKTKTNDISDIYSNSFTNR